MRQIYIQCTFPKKLTLFFHIYAHCGSTSTNIILSYQSSCHLQKLREMVPITRPFERHFPIGWLLSTSADWLVHFNGPSRRHSRFGIKQKPPDQIRTSYHRPYSAEKKWTLVVFSVSNSVQFFIVAIYLE